MGSQIQINGKTYVGNNITVNGNKVYIDGVLQEEGLSGTVDIIVSGDLASLQAEGNVKVQGSVHGNVKAGNSVKVKGDVDGNINAGNSVQCGAVGGDVDAGNSIYGIPGQSSKKKRGWL